MNRVVVMKQLKDGSGRICVHWFVRDTDGPITTPRGEQMTASGMWRKGGVKGRIACNPTQNTIVPQERGMETLLCCHTDDVRAATCPDCLATDEAKAMLQHYADMEQTLDPESAKVVQEVVNQGAKQTAVSVK